MSFNLWTLLSLLMAMLGPVIGSIVFVTLVIIAVLVFCRVLESILRILFGRMRG